MPTRHWLLTIIGLSVVAVVPAMGGEFLRAMARDFREVNQWPCPYICWDREAAIAPFPPMIENGWRRQNLLAEGHFTDNNGELSRAGQYKVRWILTEAPLEHREIFVRRGDTPEQTAARINAVRRYAAKIAPEASLPSISESSLSPAGYPAGWPSTGKNVQGGSSITRGFQPYMPDKIYLPDRTTNSGGSK